ncbi:hypothetical protein J1N35_026558 [Gossypium stocksii]|uniref:Reverse transcriptase zinc-binding domain-containing protein n=1 Tax=Gossypium stocksii TaxID=47602 RepID=A0A9D3V933_9ROSI|nr:hypothetical protein J1N35_026558 [Gossypium stocksii]
MACFLLPKSLCGELESVIANFLWQKGQGSKAFIGVVGNTCASLRKMEGNLLHIPGKAFGQRRDYYRMVCVGESALVRRFPYGKTLGYQVWDLIDAQARIWKEDIIYNTFPMDVARVILQIPLVKEAHEDMQVWKSEPSSEFSYGNAYKLLQEVWRISWNFIPTLLNLNKKRVATDIVCPRCREAVESIDHIFRECPTTTEVWMNLNLSWILQNLIQHYWEWLIWIFKNSTKEWCRVFCCGMWAIWSSRNKLVYEGKISTGKEISDWISRYLCELDEIEQKVHTRSNAPMRWKTPIGADVKINFDAAFELNQARSGSGVVARNALGEVLASKIVIHRRVPTLFAAEACACFQTLLLEQQLDLDSAALMKEISAFCHSDVTVAEKQALGHGVSLTKHVGGGMEAKEARVFDFTKT